MASLIKNWRDAIGQITTINIELEKNLNAANRSLKRLDIQKCNELFEVSNQKNGDAEFSQNSNKELDYYKKLANDQAKQLLHAQHENDAVFFCTTFE